MSSVGQVVARNSMFSVAGQLALKLLSFLFTIAVVRQLGDHDFGVYATVIAFVGIFSVFADGGIANYAVREIAKQHDRAGELFANMVVLRVGLSFIVLLANVGVALALGYPAATVGLIALASLGLLVYAVQGPLQVVLQGFERINYTASFNVLSQLVFIAVGATLLWLGGGVAAVIVASFCGPAIAAVGLWHVARRLSALQLRVDPRSWLTLLRAGLPFGIITFATMLSFKVDTVLLSLWREPQEVGWYSVAYNLIFSLLLLSSGFNSALVPSLSRQYRCDPASVEHFYLRSVRYLWTAALPLAVGGAILAEQIIATLYGPAFEPAATSLRILIWVLPVLAVTSLCGSITTVLHREHATARINLINAAFNITLNLWAIPRYGLLGAAVMTVATELLGLVQYTLLLRDTFPLRAIAVALRAPLLAAAVMAAVVMPLSALPLAVSIAAGVAVYGGCLLLTGGVSMSEVRAISSTLFGSVRRRIAATK